MKRTLFNHLLSVYPKKMGIRISGEASNIAKNNNYNFLLFNDDFSIIRLSEKEEEGLRAINLTNNKQNECRLFWFLESQNNTYRSRELNNHNEIQANKYLEYNKNIRYFVKNYKKQYLNKSSYPVLAKIDKDGNCNIIKKGCFSKDEVKLKLYDLCSGETQYDIYGFRPIYCFDDTCLAIKREEKDGYINIYINFDSNELIDNITYVEFNKNWNENNVPIPVLKYLDVIQDIFSDIKIICKTKYKNNKNQSIFIKNIID